MSINNLLVDLANDPFDSNINFKLAQEYNNLNQTASAVSFYLRAAEYGYETNPEIAYASLLKIASCVDTQKDRIHTVANALLQAVSFMPERPEAYFMMSNFYERQSKWQETYTWADLGLSVSRKRLSPLADNCGYFGEYCLEFEKAVSAWWIGRAEESYEIFNRLKNETNINEQYLNAINYNLERLGS